MVSKDTNISKIKPFLPVTLTESVLRCLDKCLTPVPPKHLAWKLIENPNVISNTLVRLRRKRLVTCSHSLYTITEAGNALLHYYDVARRMLPDDKE